MNIHRIKDQPKPQRRHIYESLEQIKESGVLSATRIAELEVQIESRITGCYTHDGRKVENSFIAELGTRPDSKLVLYPRAETGDYMGTYMRREILCSLLTDEETHMIHDHCSALLAQRNTAARFEKAIKIPQIEWNGWVTDDSEFYPSVEEYLDRWVCDNTRWDDNKKQSVMCDGVELPTFVWGTVKSPVIPSGLDAVDIVGHYVEDRGWEDMSVDDLNDVEELEKALKAFVKANEDVVSYTADYSKAIILDKIELEQV
jgi:hypothetical protein